MTSDDAPANGWPFADRPGVPLNPEQDGWHWLAVDASEEPCPFEWRASMRQWADNEAWKSPERMLIVWETYVAPCHTPAEVAALVAAGQEGMPADDPQWDATDAAHPAWWRGNDYGVEAVVKIISGVLDGDKPGTYGSEALTALTRRIAEAEAKGMETNQPHMLAALLATLERYPESAPALAWFEAASGLSARSPETEDMRWARERIAALRARAAQEKQG